MANGKSGAFGSRKGIPTPPVLVQGNVMQMSSNPKPWFADFDSMAAQCTALTTSPGMVLDYMENVELMAKVDRNELNAPLLVLTNHVRAQKERLAALVAETNRLRDEVKHITPEGSLPLLQHGEDFQNFMNDWTRIVFFAMDKVFDIFRAVGEEIPYVCPDSPGFSKVTASQMTRQEVVEAQELSFGDLQAAVAADEAAAAQPVAEAPSISKSE